MTHTRKQCLNGDRCQPRNLGEAIECLVLHSRLTVGEIAARVGKSEGYLRKAANAHYDELAMQADTLLSVSLITGNLIALKFQAAQLGHMVVAVPTAATDDTVYQTFTTAVDRLGDNGALINRVLSDKTVTEAEAKDVCRAIDETLEATAAIKTAVVARVQGATRTGEAK